MSTIQFLEALASLALQTAAVIGVTAWIGLRAPTSQRSQLWTLCFGLLLALFAAAVALPHLRWLPALWWADDELLPLVRFQQHLGSWVLAVWLTGCVLTVCGMVLRMLLTARFVATCREIPLEALPVVDGNVAGQAVRWLSSPRLPGPCCWQFHQPVVVLPEHLLQLEHRELTMVLRHELEHLRTQHPLQLFLQQVVQTLLWFHPLVWWASRQAALSRELACDEAAIAAPSDIVHYLRVLLSIVERHVASPPGPGTALGFARERSLLVARAQRLVELAQPGRQSTAPRRTAVPLLLSTSLLAAACWLPINGLASPRAVWSPWPSWSAEALHGLGLPARDYEVYDQRLELHDLRVRTGTTIRP